MKTIAQAPKNGQEVKNVENAQEVKPTAQKENPALLATIEKFKPEPLTAEERIVRMTHFEALSKRFTLLKEKSDDLKMFEAGNDKTNAKITFKNSQGFELDIRNSNVIEKLVGSASKELNILLEEAKNDVLTFEI